MPVIIVTPALREPRAAVGIQAMRTRSDPTLRGTRSVLFRKEPARRRRTGGWTSYQRAHRIRHQATAAGTARRRRPCAPPFSRPTPPAHPSRASSAGSESAAEGCTDEQTSLELGADLAESSEGVR